MSTHQQWEQARQLTQATYQGPSDAIKWAEYNALTTSEDRIQWRLRDMAEFFRLQRLNFHGFI